MVLQVRFLTKARQVSWPSLGRPVDLVAHFFQGSFRGECRWNYRLLISRSGFKSRQQRHTCCSSVWLEREPASAGDVSPIWSLHFQCSWRAVRASPSLLKERVLCECLQDSMAPHRLRAKAVSRVLRTLVAPFFAANAVETTD